MSTLSLLTSRLGLASQLNGNLSLEDLLAGKLSNGTISLVGGRKVDKSVSDRAVGTRILGDRDRLAAMVRRQQMLKHKWRGQQGSDGGVETGQQRKQGSRKALDAALWRVAGQMKLIV